MNHLIGLAELVAEPEQQVIYDALMCDPLAVLATMDMAQENSLMHPFEVGKAYYIETNTLYYAGRVVAVSACWVHLEDASWLVRTGRKSTTMATKSLDKGKFAASVPKPKTEFVGSWTISIGAIAGFCEWPVESLPKESIS